MDHFTHITASCPDPRRSVLREIIEVEGEGTEIGAA
jgi:hypothetical protein